MHIPRLRQWGAHHIDSASSLPAALTPLWAVHLRVPGAAASSLHPGLVRATLLCLTLLLLLRDTNHAPKVAVVSVRQMARLLSMLSVLYVLNERVSTPIALGMAKHLDNNPADGLLRATVMVHNSAPTGGVVLLKCAFAMLIDVHAAALSRLVCHADGWHARKAMASQQLDMTLKLDTPGFSAHVNFTSEAISSLLPRARVSVCLDLQYFNFIPKRDFDEWAFANELMGVDRIYAPDQLAYRWQVSSQAARGFVVPSHDFPHRYVGDGQRDAYNTTYSMKERSDAACNYLCLHEHWYDDWVGVAWTPDEYLTFENMGVPPPAVRTDLVSNAISGYLHVLAKSAPAWPFCVANSASFGHLRSICASARGVVNLDTAWAGLESAIQH